MHTGRRGDRLLSLAFWAALLAFLAGAVLLSVVLRTKGVGSASELATLFVKILTIASALVTLVTWRLKQRAAASEPARSEQVTRAAQELQATVREQWSQEAEARSLGDPDPMPVRWRLSDPTVMDHDDHIAPTPLRFGGRSDRIPELTDQFRKLRRRRLVIVGGPGSGKTTLAVQLVLQLLEGWQPGEPVPVLFSLANWDPHTQPRVQDWLAGQLTQTYPDLRAFGSDVAQKLADQGRLLPVLDGLDEIPPERRGEVIDRLNASLHPDTGVIVTSRTTEYTETVRTCDVLTAAAVIEPEPLTASEAAAYLEGVLPRQSDESWLAVLAALRDGTAGALAEVVASPLGLWLLRVVHIEGRHDPQPLIDPGRYPDATAIQHHLLDELIPAVVRARAALPGGQDRRRPQRHHDPDQVRRWLTTLAIELRDAQTRDWRWWQLARHTPAVSLIGLVVVLSGVLVGWWMDRWWGALGVGWLAAGLAFGLGDRDAPAHADFRVRGRAMVLGSKLTGSLVPFLGAALVASLVLKLGGGLAFWLGGGLMVGLLTGLIDFATNPSVARRASSPAESQRGDRRLAVLVTSTLWLVVALVVALVDVLAHLLGYESPWVAGLLKGLVGGLVFGLVYVPMVTKACWPGFVATSLWLGVRRRLPLRLMGFLDDTYRLGLLRVVGPVYQFRHADLQDHLAPLTEPPAVPIPPIRTR